MPHRIEQPTLFELIPCNESEPLRGIATAHASPNVISKSHWSIQEGNVSPPEPGVFKAVSPWANMPSG
jgi:hypothetical protein